MNISRLAASIGQSATLKLNEKANSLKEKGEAVIHLGGGEPEAKIPEGAVSASITGLESGQVRYTPTGGIAPLKKVVAGYTLENYGRKVSVSNVIVSGGAKQSLYTFLMAVVDPGDEVVFPAPYWVSYPEMVRMVSGVPVVVRPEEGEILPDLESVIAAVNGKTRAVIINSPNNPSGAVYPEAFIKELAEFCERKDIFLLMDDIYHKLVFDGIAPVSCFKFLKNGLDGSKLAVINGVSKSYAMTGFRIGWTVADKDVVSAMTKIQAQMTSCPSALSQAAAVGALNGGSECVEELRASLEKNRNIMLEGLKSLKKLKVHKPGGTFYCFPDFSAYDKSSENLSRLLLEKALVVTVPGHEFGLEGHLRLSYCGKEKDIREGVSRIRWALDSGSPRTMKIGKAEVERTWA